MEPTSANELLLTTLAERDSRIRTARLRLGRLIALFAGMATILLLAGHHPAHASGMSSMLPDGAGLSISIPLGDFPGPANRSKVEIFALVGSDDPATFGLDRTASPQRVAFAPVAVAGGIAGVASWPSSRLPAKRSRHTAAVPMAPGHRVAAKPRTRTAIARPSRPVFPATRIRRADQVDARHRAHLATKSYQSLLRRYLLMPQDASMATASAHARLLRAYRVARAWRDHAGMN